VAILAVLRHEEGICVDAERLVAIYCGRAKRDAEEVLQRGIEDMASRVTEIQRHFDEGNRPSLIRSARMAARMADKLGMTSFSAVAGDLIAATEAVDGPAQAATLARLLRIVDRSVTAIWDLRDMTM
jgi:hypothetical protein